MATDDEYDCDTDVFTTATGLKPMYAYPLYLPVVTLLTFGAIFVFFSDRNHQLWRGRSRVAFPRLSS